MPSFVNKIGKLFKKQETYKPSDAKKSGPKKPKTQGDAQNAPNRRKKPQGQKGRPQGGQRPPQKNRPANPSAKLRAGKPSKPWNPDSFKVEPEEGKTRFHDIDLPEEIMHAVDDLKFKYCTPIQAKSSR